MSTSDGVAIVGVGMMTSVGLTAAETLASVRSGSARFSETAWFDSGLDPITAGVVPAAGLPPDDVSPEARLLSPRERRIQGLFAGALKNCVGPVDIALPAAPMYLAAPEVPLHHRQGARIFAASLIDRAGPAARISEIVWAGAGRAGGLLALRAAAERLSSGAIPFALAGAADSYCDGDVLRALDLAGRLKSDRNLDGFIPSEGAAMLLLARTEAARQAGLPIVAMLRRPSEGFESGHITSGTPYRGDGLASTVRAVFDQRAVTLPVTDVFSSMNGESYWGKEWGVTLIRNRAHFTDDVALHHPADCFGDTGAASGPLLVALAALRSGTADAPRRSLVYASSDNGARAAVLVEPS
jgi:3-oxoacyl-[acyl-carrier-protein] synthase-1